MSFNYYWPTYKNLETEVLELSNSIFFTDDQINVYSTQIADLIVRCSVEIESIAKDLYRNNGGVVLQYKNGNEKEPKFDTDCIAYLNKQWHICDKELILSTPMFDFREDDYRIIFPLRDCTERGKGTWKCAYQNLKHNRRLNITDGNIRNLLQALGALFILNVYYADQTIDLGYNSNILPFDSNLGSKIFSVKYVDVCSHVKRNSNVTDYDVLGYGKDEVLELCKKCIYVVKYTNDSISTLLSVSDNDIIKAIKSQRREAVLIKHDYIYG